MANATAFDVRARARNLSGASPFTDAISVSSIASPAQIAAIDVDRADRLLNVSWSVPTGDWLAYDVECSDDGGSTWTATCTRGAATTTGAIYSETLTGLTNAYAYKVRARAKNALGTAAWRESDDVPAILTPARVAAISAARPTTSTISVSWSIPAGGWLSYDVECSANGGATYAACSLDAATTTGALFTQNVTVSPAQTHYVRARAKNALGTAAWRQGGPYGPLVAPAKFTSIDVSRGNGTTSITVHRSGRGWISQYDVQCSYDGGSNWANCPASPFTDRFDHVFQDSKSFTLSIANATAYHVRARAANPLGASAWTRAFSVPSISTPSRIDAIDADRGDGTLLVSWTVPAGNWLAYDIQCSDDGGSTWDATCTRGVSTSTATTYEVTLTGVTNVTPYKVRARAKNALGTAAWRESDSLPTISAPQRIAAISATRPTTSTIAVSWSIPAGNWLTYDVECSDDGGATWTADLYARRRDHDRHYVRRDAERRDQLDRLQGSGASEERARKRRLARVRRSAHPSRLPAESPTSTSTAPTVR